MSNNALMNKSKNELVEIILRKDDVEKRMRNQIMDLMKLNAELEKKLSVQKESLQTKSRKQDIEGSSCFKEFINKIKRRTKSSVVFAL